MRTKQWLPFIVLLLNIGAHGQTQTSALSEARLLRNSDVIRMVEDGIQSGAIIAKILSSRCNFDIFPPVLRDLKRRGVPDAVLLAMKSVPNGPAAVQGVDSERKSQTRAVRIPATTMIEVETAQAVSSSSVSVVSQITFFVTKRIFVDDVLVIDRGAVAKARVVKSKRAGAWGRAGMLAWEMEYVVGVDGTRIPIAVAGKEQGANRTAAIAGGAVATGALIFPYSSPVALIWGLKKGDEAVLRGSRIFTATVRTETEVAGLRPRQGGVIFHDRETVKASAAPPTNTSFERGGFSPKGFRSNR